ncbi:hypothetical protein BC829DRAFT_381638 [Chytridium lagenaria]|nr:hypothetical protein BC829DRAFT_381638 [Chytridium lagenaria]
MARLIFLSATNATMLSVISVFGFVFLLSLGALISAGSPQIVDGKEPIEEPKLVAQSCFIAAILTRYLINKEAAAERTFTSI